MGDRYVWMPQPDITLHELAMALNVLLPATSGAANVALINSMIEAMPDNVRRHFMPAP